MNVEGNRVPFTQFLRPNGERRLVWIDFDDKEVLEKAQDFIDAGYLFCAEELNNGICSFTIMDVVEDRGDIAIKLCPNGPQVPDTVRALIMETEL